MALSEFEIKKCEKALEDFLQKRRPPAHLRSEVDLAYRQDGHTIVIYELRQNYRNKAEMIEVDIAKLTFVQTKKVWKIFWMRQDLKWHSYQPYPTARTIEEAVTVVENDEHACFFG
ncbi:DUF3024 domain-containing protein [Alkalimonas collagenimarina]|uniref:DUF3024 domain-containing protein n=1 Tax=Alkalimonas collagenimarina TaxID=400390 RepID=A0ABT9GZ65_9GAMM|nr:DUF3024 domain-containing protein [Alkalimonas collagenimarina]MDP4536339.1 DUF3024 domain-containing protein [Alkalimonas collagenimarina]